MIASSDAGGSIAVIDIDGVLADATHRQHLVAQRPKDWDGFFAAVGADAVIEAGRDLLRALAREHTIVLMSGRPECTRSDTDAWLDRHGMSVDRLVLRADADHRPAAAVKAELIGGIGTPGEVAVVVDDDPAVLDRLGRLGYRIRPFP